ncbi:surface-adhesin E family protein [Variovorax sp. H27-G14]|uniref:surface-adhesin E family protein n=1 Tax=Variovorax sp. H27-G14 TaxID=3111914 RepID=UPI0038FC2919
MALGMVGCVAHAQPGWFTVVGDPLDKGADTVQVDPDRVAVAASDKAMNLRVNRASPRLNWDGIAYRSYESRVVFDCQSRRASYMAARYYTEPMWQGEPHHVAHYADAPKPVLFRDMKPNPTARIVRAACRPRAS